jgi:site-specific recombinase XerD
MAFSDTSSLSGIITRYARLAKVDLSQHKHGMHSLRHTLATRLLEGNVPLSTIADILGHTTTATAKKYMQVDISHLKACALDVEV